MLYELKNQMSDDVYSKLLECCNELELEISCCKESIEIYRLYLSNECEISTHILTLIENRLEEVCRKFF